MPKLIDIHAHINFRDFRDDGDEVIKRALKQGTWMINVGSQYSTSQRAVEYAERVYPHTKFSAGVYAAIGLHPIHLKEEFNVAKYRELGRHPKVVAVGEIGLDYYRNIEISKFQEEGLKEKQKEIFKKQLELAYQLKKPVIIHCRDAHDDVLEIVKEFPGKGVVHCFSGNLEQARKYIELGFSISFTGLITFVHNWDKVIKKSPLEKLMIETDAPYMTPAPFRGKRNEPLYVEYVAKRMAELKGLSFEEVAKTTTENAVRVFNLESVL